MKVRDLRKALKGVKGDVDVTIFMEKFCKPESKEDYMYYVTSAEFSKKSGISDDEFQLNAGEGFGY